MASSGMARADYCRRHGLSTETFERWMKHLISKEEAREHAKPLQDSRRREQRRQQGKSGKRSQRPRYSVRTDTHSRALQAFWAMHVEAMNWSGMGVREYASGLRLLALRVAQVAGPYRERRGVKPERIERAIADDLAFLAAHPVRQSEPRSAKADRHLRAHGHPGQRIDQLSGYLTIGRPLHQAGGAFSLPGRHAGLAQALAPIDQEAQPAAAGDTR